jgi:hypothetical protein
LREKFQNTLIPLAILADEENKAEKLFRSVAICPRPKAACWIGHHPIKYLRSSIQMAIDRH